MRDETPDPTWKVACFEHLFHGSQRTAEFTFLGQCFYLDIAKAIRVGSGYFTMYYELNNIHPVLPRQTVLVLSALIFVESG